MLHLLFAFRGRINRAKYWLATGILIAYTIVGSLLFVRVHFGPPTGHGALLPVVIFLLVQWIPFLVASVAIGVKRLHDRDKSGAWLLLFYLGPYVVSGILEVLGPLLAVATELTAITWVFLVAAPLAAIGISVWGFVELGCLRGTRGPNRYGPDPLPDPTIAEVFS